MPTRLVARVSHQVTVPGRAVWGLCSLPDKWVTEWVHACLAFHGKVSFNGLGETSVHLAVQRPSLPSPPCRSMWHLDRNYPYPFRRLHQGQLLPRRLCAAEAAWGGSRREGNAGIKSPDTTQHCVRWLWPNSVFQPTSCSVTGSLSPCIKNTLAAKHAEGWKRDIWAREEEIYSAEQHEEGNCFLSCPVYKVTSNALAGSR